MSLGRRHPHAPPPPAQRPCWHGLDPWRSPAPGFLLRDLLLATSPLPALHILLLEPHPPWPPLPSPRVDLGMWYSDPEDLCSSDSSATSWLCDPSQGHAQTVLSLQQGPARPWTLLVRVLGPPGESRGAQSSPCPCLLHLVAGPGGVSRRKTDTARLTGELRGSRRPQDEQVWPEKLLSATGTQVPGPPRPPAGVICPR